MTSAWPYATVPADGHVSVDADGENQVCACGNDSQSSDWMHADHRGRLSFEGAGSADPAEFAVCPECGRIYSNESLFGAIGATAPAVARYDTASPSFIRAAAEYQHAAYGSPR